MKRLWILLGLLVAGCSGVPEMTSFFSEEEDISFESEQKQKKTIVSMMLPLTGTWESTGKTFQRSALLALDENPSAAVKILFFDTQSTAEGTLKAYKWATAQDPDIILGPIFADEFKALPSSTLNQPVLGYTSDSTLLSSGHSSFAVLIPEQIREIVRYNCANGKLKLAVVGPEGKTGEIVMNALDDAVKTCPGMELKEYALYPEAKVDMSEDIRKILPKIVDVKKKNLTEEEQEILATPMEERLSFDCLLIFESGARLAQVMSVLAFYDVTPSVVPIYTLSSAKSVNDRSLNGVFMADLPSNNSFSRKYKSAFGEQPMRLGTLAYDSVSWIAKESQKGKVSLDVLREAEAYRGMDGLVRLNKDGTNRRALRLVQKKGKSVVEISPAPTEFTDEDILPEIPEKNIMTITGSTDSTPMFPSMSVESPSDLE